MSGRYPGRKSSGIGGYFNPTPQTYMLSGNMGWFVDGNFHIQMSRNGSLFQERTTANGWRTTYVIYTPHDSPEFSCPQMLFYKNILYAVGCQSTTTQGANSQSLELAFSTDGSHFTYQQTLDFSSTFGTGSGNQVFPSSWFVDNSNVVHLIFEYTTNKNLTGDSLIYHMYEVHDTSGGLLSSWSLPVQITGTGTTGYVGLSSTNSQLDGVIKYDGVSTYYLFFKNDNSTSKTIEVGSASTLTGPYTTAVKTGDWAGWSFGNGTHMEAPSLLRMKDRWRMYLDQEGHGIYYSDNFGPDVPSLLSGTWTTPVLITYDSSSDFTANNAAQHACVIVNNLG